MTKSMHHSESGNTDSENHLFSQCFRKSNSSTFKDLQTQIQGLSRTCKSPAQTRQRNVAHRW